MPVLGEVFICSFSGILLLILFAHLLEEVLHQFRAFFFHDAAFEFDFVIVAVLDVEDVVARADCA